MKKAAQISFAVVYLLLTIGIQVSTHYCGSYAMDVDFYPTDAHKEPAGCCDEPCETSCCQTTVNEFQIKDSYQSVAKYQPASIEVVDFIQPDDLISFSNQTFAANEYFISFYSPPHNDINILNCTFRI